MTHPADAALRTARLVAAFCAAVGGVYGLTDAPPSPVVLLFCTFAPLLAVIVWLDRDARRTGVAAVHDWGYFLWLAWPALIPWYAFRTRGRRGLEFLVGVVLLILSAHLGALAGTLVHDAFVPDAVTPVLEGESLVWNTPAGRLRHPAAEVGRDLDAL